MLLSDSYRQLIEKEHQKDPKWGQTAVRRVSKILEFASRFPSKHILDYGSGSGSFGAYLSVNHPEYTVFEYEPAKADKASPPNPCEFVICVDVLEHVEPDCVDAVLDDLKRVVLHTGLFTVCMVPAGKILSDGRNAHLTIQPADWWLEKIRQRFTIELSSHDNKGLFVIVRKI